MRGTLPRRVLARTVTTWRGRSWIASRTAGGMSNNCCHMLLSIRFEWVSDVIRATVLEARMPPYLQGLRGSITSFSHRVLIRATVLEAHMPPNLQGLRGSITSLSHCVLIRATVLEAHMPPYLQGFEGVHHQVQ